MGDVKFDPKRVQSDLITLGYLGAGKADGKGLAEICAAFVVLLAAGCSGSPSQSPAPGIAPASDIGFVTGVLGLELSPAPAEPAARTAASDLALVVHTQQARGVTWRRLVVADGTTGWTSRAFDNVRAARVRASARSLSLLSKSPDDPAFSEAEEIRVGDDIEGQIVGVSRRARVAGNEQLMLPERYRRSLPWLELKFGSTQGFAPFDWIALLPPPSPVTSTLEEALDALGARGLVWKPFLGGLVSEPAVMRVTTGTVYELNDPASLPRKAQAAREWSALEFVFRDERGLMVVYTDGPRRMFRFTGDRNVPVDIVLNGDFALPAQVRHTDINADGAQDWLVEIAARYGDGFYAVLWIIDGRTAADSLTLERLLLSHSTGESPSTDVNANWQLRDDGTIHVTRGRAGEERTAVYRYGSNRLTEVR